MDQIEFTTNIPPAAVNTSHVVQALQALGLGFHGVTAIHIYTDLGEIVTVWTDTTGLERRATTTIRDTNGGA